MQRRLARQLAYGGIFFAITLVALGALFVALFRPGPSCADGVKNQNEEGIDCGGACERLCNAETLQPLRLVGKVKALYAGEANATLVVEIENPNGIFASRNVAYDIALHDSGGSPLTTLSGSSFIYGGEIKHLLFPNLPFRVDQIAQAAITVATTAWIPAEDFPRPAPSVRNLETVTGDIYLEARGVLQNEEAEALSRITVLALFHGRFGEIAGASLTELDALAAGEARPFAVLHPVISGVDAAATEIFVSALRP